jgi:hypothetical protein
MRWRPITENRPAAHCVNFAGAAKRKCVTDTGGGFIAGAALAAAARANGTPGATRLYDFDSAA